MHALFKIVLSLLLAVAVLGHPTSNPDALGVHALKKGKKPTEITVTWNQGYTGIDSFAKFSQRWRYLCETVVAPIHEHHRDAVIKGKKPCTARVYCEGLQTDGKDDNAVIKGGYKYDQTINTYKLGHKWGWLAYSYSDKVCSITAKEWKKM